jgi:hypothetical protein
MFLSGAAINFSICEAVSDRGESARRFRGRFERGSADVGTDSGMFSDMMKDVFVTVWF